MMRNLAMAAVLAAGVYSATGDYAAAANGTFQVNMTITATCTLDALNDLNFGSTGSIDTNIDESTTLEVTCSTGTPYNVGLDAGLNGTGINDRKMQNVAGTDTITYQLYTDNSHSNVWGNTANTDTFSGTGTGSGQSLTVYGRVAPQTAPAPGSYGDTVTISVNY